jgi:hypothetical protein
MFAMVMIRVFAHVYPRSPNEEETRKFMAMNEKTG